MGCEFNLNLLFEGTPIRGARIVMGRDISV